VFDGSLLPLAENLRLAAVLLEECSRVGVVLEVEIGIVGGEEDGIDHLRAADERLYSTLADAVAVVETLGAGERGRSTPQQIAEAISYGVVKLNLDTDMRYASTRAVAHHVFRNYDGVVRADGGVGDKAFDHAPGAAAPRPRWPRRSATLVGCWARPGSRTRPAPFEGHRPREHMGKLRLDTRAQLVNYALATA
jgi:fructose/tagatose bisphosphate aldolase